MTNSVGAAQGNMLMLMLQNQQLAEADSKAARDAQHEVGVAMLEVSHVYREIEEKNQEWEHVKGKIDLALAGAQALNGGQGGQGAQGQGGGTGTGTGTGSGSGTGTGSSSGTGGSTQTPSISNAPSPSGAGRAQAQQAAGNVGDTPVDGPTSDGSPEGTVEADRQPSNAQRNAERAAGEGDATRTADNGRTEANRDQQEADGKKKKKETDPLEATGKIWGAVTKYTDKMIEENNKAAQRSKELAKRSSDAQFKVADKAHEGYQGERELTQQVIEIAMRRPKGEMAG